MIDFICYNKGKQVLKRSNLWQEDAFELLEINKNIDVDKIDIEVYSTGFSSRTGNKEHMPIAYIEDVTSIRDAQNWINYTMGELIKKGNEKEKS